MDADRLDDGPECSGTCGATRYGIRFNTGMKPLSDNTPAPGEEESRGGAALDQKARAELASLLRTHRHPPAIAKRIQGLLLLADGLIPSLVARRLGVSVGTVMYWRKQFDLLGSDFLRDGRLRDGRVKR